MWGKEIKMGIFSFFNMFYTRKIIFLGLLVNTKIVSAITMIKQNKCKNCFKLPWRFGASILPIKNEHFKRPFLKKTGVFSCSTCYKCIYYYAEQPIPFFGYAPILCRSPVMKLLSFGAQNWFVILLQRQLKT